jgi:hypothetical protein
MRGRFRSVRADEAEMTARVRRVAIAHAISDRHDRRDLDEEVF